MSPFFIVLLIVFCGVTAASEVCVGKCPIRPSPNSSIVFLPNVNCSKYCVCDHGRPIEMLCPPNLHFSPEYNTCADPEQANCTDLTSTVPTTPDEFQYPNNYLRNFDSNSLSELNSKPGIRYNTYCANPWADCREKPLNCIGKCPKDYANQIFLLAHEDCTKYCKCNNTEALTKNCPKGLHFSFEVGICLAPKEAKCDRVNGVLSTTVSPEPSYTCVSECPYFDNNQNLVVLVAHELCEKYCHCKNGIAVPKDCPLHLHFSLPHGTCVDPNIAQCYVNNTVTPKPDTPQTPKPDIPQTPKPDTPQTPKPSIPQTPKPDTPQTPKPDTPQTPKPDTPQTPKPDTTEKPNELGCIGTCPLTNYPNYTFQLPHTNCNKFCKCDWGKPSVMLCPHNLHYNPNIQVCDYPEKAGCTGVQKSLMTFTKNHLENTTGCLGTCPSNSDPTEIVQLPHEYCNKFCKCEGEELAVHECPYPLFYDPELEVCDHPYMANCTGKLPIGYKIREENASTADCVEPCPLNNPYNQTVHVAHKDCTKFCKCSFGYAWVMDCPKDLYFNPKEQVCDFKFNVHCDENGPWVDEKEINGKDIDQSQTNNVENSIWQKFKQLFHH